MWAVRRASNPLRTCRSSLRGSRVCFAESETASTLEESTNILESVQVKLVKLQTLKRFYNTSSDFPKLSVGSFSFSSQAGTKSSGEEDDDSEDGFSELESLPSSDVVQDNNMSDKNDEQLISDLDISEEENEDNVEETQNELELSDIETDVNKKKPGRNSVSSELFTAIMAASGVSIRDTLDNWVKEGNDITRAEISTVMLGLRRRRMYGRALQVSEWLESSKRLEFGEGDYASRVDLIAKMRGLHAAEIFIEKMPKALRSEKIYRTLLANCVSANHVKKAEEVFNKMKDLEFPLTTFACNQMLLLYKRVDKKKIADVLLLMEKESVKPSLFTYRILIDTKGQSNDIAGMDQIVETMKAEGIEPDIFLKAILARHYISGGVREKADFLLKEMEGGDGAENRRAFRNLLPLYASLGKVDEVRRLWKSCEHNPRIEECLAAIEAWGKLNRVEEAEAVFEKMLKTWRTPYSNMYTAMLKVYANHKMLEKGKELVKRMGGSGSRIGPLTWDAIVKLYVAAGEVEKADSILQKAVQQNQNKKPMFTSYMVIMNEYVKRGDVHNSEKMFHRMRQAGYTARLRQFQALIQAYINAKAPGYGMKERMKADNIFPTHTIAGQLAQVDPFRKTAVSDLLD